MVEVDKKAAGGGLAGIASTVRPILALIIFSYVFHESKTILTRAYNIRLHAIENYGYSKILRFAISCWLVFFL